MLGNVDKNRYTVITFVASYMLVIASYGGPSMRCAVWQQPSDVVLILLRCFISYISLSYWRYW